MSALSITDVVLSPTSVLQGGPSNLLAVCNPQHSANLVVLLMKPLNQQHAQLELILGFPPPLQCLGVSSALEGYSSPGSMLLPSRGEPLSGGQTTL